MGIMDFIAMAEAERAANTAARIEKSLAAAQPKINPYDVLHAAREKLKLYRGQHSGEYVGGMEYTTLMELIDKALAERPPTLSGTD